MTIKLLNNERGIFGPNAKRIPKAYNLPTDGERLSKEKSEAVRTKLQNRRQNGGAARLKTLRLNN